MRIGTRDFSGGMNRAMDRRMLPANMAWICTNASVSTGKLVPLRGLGPGPRGSGQGGAQAQTAFFLGGWRFLDRASTVVRHPDSDRVIWASTGQEPRQATEAMLNGGIFRRLGVPSPSVAPSVVLSGECGEDLLRSTSYVYTLVTDLGEESGFSPPSKGVDIYVGQKATISGMSASAPANTVITKVRIYRAETDNYGEAMFQFVGEVSPGASFTDAGTEAHEVGNMKLWLEPPSTIASMCLAANGIMAAIHGNGGDRREVCLSEPGVPYAFPQRFRVKLPHPATHIFSVGAAIVVLTDERPCLIYAASPESAQITPLPKPAAGVSLFPQGGAASQFGLIYPSHDGLVRVTEGGEVMVISTRTFTRDAWLGEMSPGRMLVAVHDDRIFYFLHGDTPQGQGNIQGGIFDAETGVFVALEDITPRIRSVYVDHVSDALYVLHGAENSPAVMKQMCAADADVLTARWESGVFEFPRAVGFSAFRIRGDFDPAVQYAKITVRNERGEEYTTTVTEEGIYRLPSRLYTGLTYSIETNAVISGLEIASSSSELLV